MTTTSDTSTTAVQRKWRIHRDPAPVRGKPWLVSGPTGQILARYHTQHLAVLHLHARLAIRPTKNRSPQ